MSDQLSLSQIKKAYHQSAKIVARYGNKYLPIFERLEKEAIRKASIYNDYIEDYWRSLIKGNGKAYPEAEYRTAIKLEKHRKPLKTIKTYFRWSGLNGLNEEARLLVFAMADTGAQI